MDKLDDSSVTASKLDLHSREARVRLAQMVMRIFDLWGLSISEQAKLLGLSVNGRTTIARYRRGSPLADYDDLISRVGHLFGIFDSLNMLFPHNPELAHRWVKQRSSILHNRTALEIMQEEGYEGILAIRRYLDYLSHQ